MIRVRALQVLSRFFLVLTLVAIVGIPGSLYLYYRRPAQVLALVPMLGIPTFTPEPTRTPTPTRTPVPPPIAIVAGHSGGADPGASCTDGLREVDITTEVARRIKASMDARGNRVEILAEFDARLSAARKDYSPRVFLSIHADSCVYEATGYKIVRAEKSAIPQEDDRFVRCISSTYANATKLPFHEGSITRDMTHYHGLNEINPQTPAAIIELGFLGGDHDLLKFKRDILSNGIVAGIESFLKGSACQ